VEWFSEKLTSSFRVITVICQVVVYQMFMERYIAWSFMAMAIKRLIDYLGLKKVFLTGHSLGGYVALAFLELFPDNLSGYCLFHSQPFSDSPAALEKRNREIEIVKVGKKNLMYPDNVIECLPLQTLKSFLMHFRGQKILLHGFREKG